MSIRDFEPTRKELTPELLEQYRQTISSWSFDDLIDELCKQHRWGMSPSLLPNDVRIAQAKEPIVKAAIYEAARRERQENGLEA